MANSALQETVTKVGALLRLAADEQSADAESHNACKSAVQLITEHDLVLVPRSELERAKAAVDGNNKLVREVAATKQRSMVIGGLLGFMAGGGKLGRFGGR